MASSPRAFAKRLPAQHEPRPGALVTRPKSLGAWLDGLSMENEAQTVRCVFAALREVNRYRLRPAARWSVLELLRAPVEHISRALERHYLGAAFPWGAEERKYATLDREFQAEMAIGYKAIVEGLRCARGTRGLLNKRALAGPTQRAIRYLALVLLKSYQFSAPCPENVWREIHDLYRFAEQVGYQDRPVEESSGLVEEKISVAATYKQILLLAMAGPYRLRQPEVATIYGVLHRWTPYCTLVLVGDPLTPAGMFAVRPDSDDQPALLDVRHASRGGVHWVLDTTRLAALLRKEVLSRPDPAGQPAGDQGGPAAGELPPELVRRLMLAWGMMTQRRASRSKAQAWMDLVVGLDAVHRCLSRIADAQESGAPIESSEVARSPEVDLRHCAVLDEGAGGYRLRCPTSGSDDLRAGVLVAMRSTSDTEVRALLIGVVRWARQVASGHETEIGIESLGTEVEAVAIRVCDAAGRCGEDLPGLLSLPIGPPHPAVTLVTPGFVAKLADRVEVGAANEARIVRLTHALASSSGFAQFQFAAVQDETARDRRLARREADREYDPLWADW